ncbi:1-deoxy-D-xylulose-5-phosphate reductoisomerase [Chengkuizengella axinellae]|uniref:1-deoxy-D-xylulose 5-phosphate reductoisomerase n=1 Tax=Chengkuizengella axinellae TaxID=3064388 RepID=A0ABT9IVT5_9BACL|nr:1-deoxy-D-xylulose-5-phosphate reductoisomerase [Chengkuizengella sp. 2205SS18-9]MDP5273475.1 1-deoxy-D-xylulose-5-phosphate reductoisomerase [Chengkuizengella sp. 2205SS18-9]
MSKRISILGSTGSIGTQTLDCVAMHPDEFIIEGLAAGSNLNLLVEQVNQFQPKKVSVATKSLAQQLKSEIPSSVQVYYGEEGLIEVAANTDASFVVNALVGSQGLKPTIYAIESGKHIGLANKETLVTAGHIIKQLIEKHEVQLLPIDSEHSAIFQCLNGESLSEVSNITLTASGGSFRDRTREELVGVTVEEALSHPNWSMGAKVTIDSATMVNKGLEVIEAHWLFDIPYEQIGVVIHPESIVHSFVEFNDRSVIAQLGNPDMRVPIQYALTYPDRFKTSTEPLDLTVLSQLNFNKMDFKRFPCLKMAYDCGKIGGSATTVFNAANEVAVSRFLRGDIQFLQIEEVIHKVIDLHSTTANPELEELMEIDSWARDCANKVPSSSC